MLTLAPQQNIIEKVLKTRAGGFVRARFLVVEYQGQVRVKLLSATPIEAAEAFAFGDVVSGASNTAAVQALPAPVELAVFEFVKSLQLESVVYPHLAIKAILKSQPTRAPSFAF
ncbi:MAG: hypothetical protein AAB391_00860 [Patescibacteria group bacterium]